LIVLDISVVQQLESGIDLMVDEYSLEKIAHERLVGFGIV
jgi:hypothetical protein